MSGTLVVIRAVHKRVIPGLYDSTGPACLITM